MKKRKSRQPKSRAIKKESISPNRVSSVKRRINWDSYFMKIAELVSERSTCLRRKVGAVLVQDRRILATGYNGAPKGLVHCQEIGCLREKLKIKPSERIEICRGVHAEQNALVQAASFGIKVADAFLYCTHQPCITCMKLLINAGIKGIYVKESYPDSLAQQMLKNAKLKIQIVK